MAELKGITMNTDPTAEAHIYAEDDAAIYQSIVGSDGVMMIGQQCASQVISNNKVRIKDGVLVVGGHFARLPYGSYKDCTIENGQSGRNRNDLIIAKFVTTGSGGIDTYTLEVKKGTSAAGSAKDPALTQNDLYESGKTREMPLYRVKIEGLSIVAVEQMFELVPTIPKLNADLAETIYDRSALPIADFYDVTDFDLRRRGNEVFFNVSISMQSGTQFDPNTLYSIGPSAMLAELRPSKVYYLNGFGCDSNWGDSIAISVYVDASGYVRYSALSRKTYFKISGHWIAG